MTDTQKVGCPHCGGSRGFIWKDYGHAIEKTNEWGRRNEEAKCVHIHSSRRPAVYARCLDCDKRVVLDKAQEQV